MYQSHLDRPCGKMFETSFFVQPLFASESFR